MHFTVHSCGPPFCKYEQMQVQIPLPPLHERQPPVYLLLLFSVRSWGSVHFRTRSSFILTAADLPSPPLARCVQGAASVRTRRSRREPPCASPRTCPSGRCKRCCSVAPRDCPAGLLSHYLWLHVSGPQVPPRNFPPSPKCEEHPRP